MPNTEGLSVTIDMLNHHHPSMPGLLAIFAAAGVRGEIEAMLEARDAAILKAADMEHEPASIRAEMWEQMILERVQQLVTALEKARELMGYELEHGTFDSATAPRAWAEALVLEDRALAVSAEKMLRANGLWRGDQQPEDAAAPEGRSWQEEG